MAGNIYNVNLTKLNADISEYTTLAEKLHSSACSISSSIGSLKNCWSGKRVNTVITAWNTNREEIDVQVFYFAMKIKLILMEIKNQYSNMEKGSTKDSSYGYGWGGILKADLTDETTIKFSSATATTIVKNIQTESTNIAAYLKQLVSKLDQIATYSDSLKSLQTNYTANAANLQKSLTKLCSTIQTEAQLALNDAKATEAFNESDAARAKTIDKKSK